MRDAEDTRRYKETPEATRVKPFDDQVGANAAAETTDAAQDGKEHDMPQLAFLDEYQRSTVIVIVPECSGLVVVSCGLVSRQCE
ncbi:MAG: hypothetical protein Q9188_005490 [Gyalolechia gomerana]